jgi:hypothetical protein
MIPAVNGWHAAIAALLLLTPRSSPAAEDLPGAARELARKTVGLGGRGSVGVSYRNLSSLPDSELAQVRREFEAALERGAEASPLVEVRITLSENGIEYLLVEEVRKGDETQVWMVSWKRMGPARVAAPGLALDRRLVWEQDEPVLDLAFTAAFMVVLEPARIILYARQSGQWQPQQALALRTPKPGPRDLRGHLRVTGGRIQALLPGIECDGAVEPTFAMDCRPGEEPWILESGSRALLAAYFVPDRNYFDGRVTLQNGSRKSLPPFYSAAAVEDPAGTFWMLALLDGRTQVFNTAFEAVAAIPGWGSDLVGTSARCAGGSQVLATRPLDGSEPDALQAFSVVNGAAVPVTAPVAFPGPVTALWPSAATSALAVARDPATGKYGAYVVTVVCGP